MLRRFAPLAVSTLLLTLLAAGCAPPALDTSALFPEQVGEFARTSGPGVEAETGVDVAVYEAPEGVVRLRVRQVAEEEIAPALAGLPPAATDVGPDEALGQRQGTFFSFGGEYHAAWANGDWVFVLSASSDYSRRAFLASYSY